MDKKFDLGINRKPNEMLEIQSGTEIDPNDDEKSEEYIDYPELEIEITSKNLDLLKSIQSGKAVIDFDVHSMEEVDGDDYGYSPDAKYCLEIKIKSISPVGLSDLSKKTDAVTEKPSNLSDAFNEFVRNKIKNDSNS